MKNQVTLWMKSQELTLGARFNQPLVQLPLQLEPWHIDLPQMALSMEFWRIAASFLGQCTGRFLWKLKASPDFSVPSANSDI